MSAPLFIEPTAATAPALASAAGSSAGFVADFIQVAAGVHAVDLNAILRPLFDLVEIARVPLPHAIAWRDFSLFAASEGNVIAKETKHFASSVRPSRIGIGSSETAARPSVASSMDAPLL
jgi:hypothetical protein